MAKVISLDLYRATGVIADTRFMFSDDETDREYWERELATTTDPDEAAWILEFLD